MAKKRYGISKGDKTEKVTVRFADETLKEIDKLIIMREFDNITDVVRYAVETYLASYFNKKTSDDSIDRSLVDLPLGVAKYIDELVADGKHTNRSEAIKYILQQYVEKQEKPTIEIILSPGLVELFPEFAKNLRNVFGKE